MPGSDPRTSSSTIAPLAATTVTERGGRIQTRQRTAVWAALETAGEFQSAQQLHARLRADGDGVGLATVYRTLQQLADDGAVDVLRTADGEAVCAEGLVA